MENFANDFTTSLSAPVTDVATTILVNSSVGAPAPNFRIRIDNEYMLVTSKGTGLNWTVTRGIEGSTAAGHSSGALVYQIVTVGGLKQAIWETDSIKNLTVTYNPDGSVNTATQNGVTVTYSYENGRVSGYTTDGLTTTISYNAQDQVTSITTI